MTYKRRVLSALSRDDLLEIGRAFELEVTARMSADDLRETIAKSKKTSVAKFVSESMSRETLKAICEACGLESSGKEKQPLVARIVAAANGEGNGNGNGSSQYTIDPEVTKPSVASEGGAAFALTNPTAAAKKAQARSAPRRSSGGASDDIVAYQHDDKRKNNPPAGLVEFDKPPPQPTKTYQYDPHLDPQLAWAGKAEHTSFEVDTVSLHIHEDVRTEAILRAVKREDAQLDFFKKDELTDAKAIDFYQHDIGWRNRLILGDSLLVMNSLLEREEMAGKVQMIYLDPPYGVKFNSNFQAAISRRDVKDGDDASLTREPEQIQAYRDTWSLGVHTYLTYLRDRLKLSRELLSDSGSLFVQISEENLHHVRELLDEIFGADNFIVLICYRRLGMMVGEILQSSAHYIIWMAKHRELLKHRKLFERQVAGIGTGDHYTQLEHRVTGETRSMTAAERANPFQLSSDWSAYRLTSLTTGGYRPNTTVNYRFDGRVYHPGSNKCWRTTVDGLDRLARNGRIIATGKNLSYKQYLDDFPLTEDTSIWEDTARDPENYYVVQTPSNVIKKCILMSTDPGDLVLDPTCGSGTTAAVAEQWGRRWITCDTSRVALALARQRLLTGRYPFYALRSTRVRDGFVYTTVPHITLKTVAQNPRLDECKTKNERDRVIREAADQEVLYDQPEVDGDRVRVSGPFTVEAIPVAALESSEDSSVTGPTDSPPSDHVGMMIDLLRKSGVQFPNNRHLSLATLHAVRGPFEYLHAEADVPNGTTKRVAVSFGPRHAPVTPTQVLGGISETRGYDMVLFVGFACDPEARRIIDTGVHGRELQFANAAPDILVGDLLKTKKTTRLFSTFGAPDVRVDAVEDDLIKLTLAGVDLYDPNSGETHHRSGEDVAAWFIDHDYDGRTFCVCQALFPGGGKNPWEKLQKALKGTIDEDKFETLRTATSLPFKSGKKVAVKVIDDRGNEVIKLVDPKPRKKASS